MSWIFTAPRIPPALDAADEETRPMLEARLATLFEPWITGRIDAHEFLRRLSVTDVIHEERDPAFRVQQREMTAYHEAGHAIAAHLLGCRVNTLSIVPTTHDLAYGHVGYNPLLGQSAEDDSLITLAGPIAQAFGGYLGGMEEHRRQCNVRILDDRPGLSVATRLALLRYLEIRAQEIVTGHWATISRVALALLAAGTLEREAFLAAVAPVELPSAESAA